MGSPTFDPEYDVPLFHCSECGRELRKDSCGKCGTEGNPASNWIPNGKKDRPTPPAPADDASGAEAMREACARRVEKSYLDRPAYNHGDSPEWVASNETRRIAAAIRALPLPGATPDATRVPARREDAVVEAAKFAGYEVERAHFDAWWADKSDGWRRASCKGADLSGVAWDAYYERALWGTRPEGHSPASGQGGV